MSRMFIASSIKYRPDRSGVRPGWYAIRGGNSPSPSGAAAGRRSRTPAPLSPGRPGACRPGARARRAPGKQSDAGSLDEHPLTPGSLATPTSSRFRGGSPEPADDVTVPPTSPRLRAMLLAVPTGRIASGIFRPARATTTFATVPSPPATTTSSPGIGQLGLQILCFLRAVSDVVSGPLELGHAGAAACCLPAVGLCTRVARISRGSCSISSPIVGAMIAGYLPSIPRRRCSRPWCGLGRGRQAVAG